MKEESEDIKEPGVIKEKVTKKEGKKMFCITSLVLGIVAIAFFWISYAAIPCGILAIIFGILGRKSEEKGIAIAGIITGAIGLIVSILLLIVLIYFVITSSNGILENVGYDNFVNDSYDDDSEYYLDDNYDYDEDIDADTNEDIIDEDIDVDTNEDIIDIDNDDNNNMNS